MAIVDVARQKVPQVEVPIDVPSGMHPGRVSGEFREEKATFRTALAWEATSSQEGIQGLEPLTPPSQEEAGREKPAGSDLSVSDGFDRGDSKPVEPNEVSPLSLRPGASQEGVPQ